MDKSTSPPEGVSTGTVSEKKLQARKRIETGDVIAGVAAIAGAIHVRVNVPEKPPELEQQKLTPNTEHPDWRYTAVGNIVQETMFQDETHTGGIQNNFVDLFETVFTSTEGTYYYFDTKGTVLLTTHQPEALRLLKESVIKARKDKKNPDTLIAELKKQTQAWHNENRKKISDVAVVPVDYAIAGYPFITSPTLPGVEIEGEKTSLLQVVMERLKEKTKSLKEGPRYFQGEERSIYNGIVEIAKAYDMPRAIVLGVAANESGYDRDAISKADARGVFQFTKGGFNDAKEYLQNHPELGMTVRSGSIGTFEDSWKNRFVSAELFCVYFRVIQKRIRPDVEKLERRLSKIDSSYQTGVLLDIATINAYNAGANRISDCINRFLSLSDTQIQSHIGKPPYGVDTWLAVTGLSFGLTDKNKATLVGPDVFLYPQKVLAMGALIMEENNYLSVHERERDDAVTMIPDPQTRRGLWQGLMIGSGITALAAGLFTGARTLKDTHAENPNYSTRRDFLRTTAATIGIASPIVRAGKKWFEERKVSPLPDIEVQPMHHELFKEVMIDAKFALDELLKKLKQNAEDGKTGWTADELDQIYQYLVPENRKLLAKRFEAMFGKDLVKRFAESERLKYEKRIPVYNEAIPLQRSYIEQEKNLGNLMTLTQDDPSLPYFCEQVGKPTGVGNDPDAMYTRKEFLPVLGTLIELVNYQIDAFNVDPSSYGILNATFPTLPHIRAVKISGALRFVEGTMEMFEKGQGGRTTTGTTPHWLGYTLDIASFATDGSHMVRLDEDLLEEKGGTVKVKRGDKLPSQGFGKRTRELYSTMIGRALFAMREPLMKQQRIEIQPLWEGYGKDEKGRKISGTSKVWDGGQLNWHIAMEVQE